MRPPVAPLRAAVSDMLYGACDDEKKEERRERSLALDRDFLFMFYCFLFKKTIKNKNSG